MQSNKSQTITNNHEQSRTINERNRSNAMEVSRPPLPQLMTTDDHSFHNASPNRIHQRSSVVISGHQRSSVAISGRQWSSVVIGGDMTTQALLTDVQPACNQT
jgi:hypothetical protein